MLRPSRSVGWRLAMLAASQILAICVLVSIAIASLVELESSVRFARRNALPPVEAVGRALIENGYVLESSSSQLEVPNGRVERARLKVHADDLRALAARYRSDWEAKNNPAPDAKRARETLRAVGRPDIIDEEARAVDNLDRATRSLAVLAEGSEPTVSAKEATAALRDLQTSLRELRRVSTAYVAAEHEVLILEARTLRNRLVLLGLGAIVIAVLAALHVRRAISFRIRRLFDQVQGFRQTGEYVRIGESADDDIAVLANAIDAGLASILERDRERASFLSGAAHELKTPLASILGYAQVANRSPSDGALGRRALDTVERHALRLTGLLDDVFLAVRARDEALTTHPTSFDLADAVRKTANALEKGSNGRTIVVDGASSLRVLADLPLITQAVRLLLGFAQAIAHDVAPIHVSILESPTRARVVVEVDARELAGENVEDLLAPFGSVAYEGRGTIRTGVGLFLCREIARAHGGALHITSQRPHLVLELDLPA